MPLRVLTIQMNEHGVFDDRELQEFSEKYQVTSFFKDLVVWNGIPTIAIFLEYRPKQKEHPVKQYFGYTQNERSSSVSSVRSSSNSPQQDEPPTQRQFTPEQQSMYDLLRHWRNQRAIQESRPPMNILHNVHLADIVVLRPKSTHGLQQISGIGKNKANKYGPHILSILHNTPIEEITIREDGSLLVQEKPTSSPPK